MGSNHTKAQDKYDRANTVQMHLKFNVRSDADVLDKLNSCENKQGYIKRLIREDMAKNRK